MSALEAGSRPSASRRRLLELPIDAAFRRNADGSVSVYPWPWPLRVGSVLPDAEAEAKLHRIMKRWLYLALPAFVAFGIIGPSAIVALGIVYVAAYYVRMLFALHGLSRSHEPRAIEITRKAIGQPAKAAAVQTRSS